MKSLKKKCTFLEDKKGAPFFKVSYAIVELGGPPLFWDSMFISSYELESKVSKIKDKWVRQFDNLMSFSEDDIRAWTVDYINLNNNIWVIISESHDEVIEIEK